MLGEPEGLIKTIFDAKTGEQFCYKDRRRGDRDIQGYVIGALEMTETELMNSARIPLTEMMHESVLAAYGQYPSRHKPRVFCNRPIPLQSPCVPCAILKSASGLKNPAKPIRTALRADLGLSGDSVCSHHRLAVCEGGPSNIGHPGKKRDLMIMGQICTRACSFAISLR